MRDLTAVAPVLVVEASGRVLPLTHEISPRFSLGSLHGTRLAVLAERWLASPSANLLARSCARTYRELCRRQDAPPYYWYDEVAARTHLARIHHPSGSGMNSLSSPGTIENRSFFQSSFARSRRSLELETKFQKM